MRRHVAGFTLLELLVALAIFALLSVMAYAGLGTVLDTRQILETDMERLNEVQRSMVFMSRDFLQAVDRGIRDEYGDAQGSLTGSKLNAELGAPLIELTRTGYPNPLGVKRSQLLRVAYRLKDKTLYRETWSMLDRAPDSQPYSAVLCENVSELAFRYLDVENQWHEEWPPNIQNYQGPPLPKAVELSLELADWGLITKLVPMAGA